MFEETLAYLGLNSLSMILYFWPPPPPPSYVKVASNTNHAQNLEEQLWMEGGRGWVLYHRSVWLNAILGEKNSFLSECLNIFPTGYSEL